MHLGHNLLLTQACLVTGRTLHCGVTSDTLLTKKAYSNLIEPFEVRLNRVKSFLGMVAPHLQVEYFELQDPLGIAATMDDL